MVQTAWQLETGGAADGFTNLRDWSCGRGDVPVIISVRRFRRNFAATSSLRVSSYHNVAALPTKNVEIHAFFEGTYVSYAVWQSHGSC